MNGQVVLSWDEVLGARSYDVYIGTADAAGDGNYNRTPRKTLQDGGVWRRMVGGPGITPDNHWTFNARMPDTYYWTVQAVGAAFVGSPLSVSKTFTVTAADIPTTLNGDGRTFFVSPGVMQGTEIATFSVSPTDAPGAMRTYSLVGDPNSGDRAFFSISDDRLLLNQEITPEMEREARLFTLEVQTTKDGTSVSGTFFVRVDYGVLEPTAARLAFSGDAARLETTGSLFEEDADVFYIQLETDHDYSFVFDGVDANERFGSRAEMTLHYIDPNVAELTLAGIDGAQHTNNQQQAPPYLIELGRLSDAPGTGTYRLSLSGNADTFAQPRVVAYTLTINRLPFQELSTAVTPLLAPSLALGDIDNDGDLDLLHMGIDRSGFYPELRTNLYENDGNGTFSLVGDIDTTNGTSNDQFTGMVQGAAALADLDNDGDLDVLLTGQTFSNSVYSTSAQIYLNLGGGDFRRSDSASSRLRPAYKSALDLGDIDNDGDLDLLLTGVETDLVGSRDETTFSALYTNDGQGNFQQASEPPGWRAVDGGAVSFGDVDGDGDLDIALAGRLDSNSNPQYSDLFLNNGDGTFQTDTGRAYGALGEAPSLTMADLTNDGNLEVLVSGRDDTILNKTSWHSASLGTTSRIGDGVRSGAMACGDFDNDNLLDLFLTGNEGDASNLIPEARLYRNAWTGSPATYGDFAQLATLPGVHTASVVLGDADGDGNLDIFFAGSDADDQPAFFVYQGTSPTAAPALPGPENLSVSVSGATATLSWDAVPEAISYDVYLGTADASTDGNYNRTPRRVLFQNGTWHRTVADLGSVQGHTWAFTAPPGTYYWAVQVVNGPHRASPLVAASASFEIVNQPPTGLTLTPDVLRVAEQSVGGRLARFLALDPNLLDQHTYALVEDANSTDDDFFSVTGRALFLQGVPTDEMERDAKIFSFAIRVADAQGATYDASISVSVDYGDAAEDAYEVDTSALAPNSEVFLRGRVGSNTDQDWLRIALEEGREYVFQLGATGAGTDIAIASTSLLLYGAQVENDLSVLPLRAAMLAQEGRVQSFSHTSTVSGDYYLRISGDGVATGTYRLALSVLPLPSFVDAAAALEAVTLGGAVFGDVTNDGSLDILLSGEDAMGVPITRLYTNDGGGNFSEDTAVSLPGARNGTSLLGDVDHDGDLDLVLVGDGMSGLYTNTGGSFSEAAVTLPSVDHGAVALGDVDNDGDLDLLLTGTRATDDYISHLYKNDGFGAFTRDDGVPFPGISNGFLLFRDLDSNGTLDLLLAGDTPRGPTTQLYENDGLGNFTLSTVSFVGLRAGAAASADADGDGDWDLLLMGDDGTTFVTILYTNQGGNFVPVADIHTEAGASNDAFPGLDAGDAAFGDVDNDGDFDLFLMGVEGTIHSTMLYVNDGRGNFRRLDNVDGNTDPADPFVGVGMGSISLGDMDRDGDLDCLFTGQRVGGVPVSQLYRNDMMAPLVPLIAPQNLTAVVNTAQTAVTLAWGAVSGATYEVYLGSTDASSDGNYDRTPRKTLLENATVWRRMVEGPGAIQTNTYTMHPRPGTYYWAVQTVHSVGVSPLAVAADSFEIRNLAPTGIATRPATVKAAVGMTSDELAVFSTIDPNPADVHTYTLEGLSAQDQAYFSLDGHRLVLGTIPTDAMEAAGRVFSPTVKTTDLGGLSFSELLPIEIDYGDAVPTASLLDVSMLSPGGDLSRAGLIKDATDQDWFRLPLEGGREYVFQLEDTSAGGVPPSFALYEASVAEDPNASAINISFFASGSAIRFSHTPLAASSGDYYLQMLSAAGDPHTYRITLSTPPKHSFVERGTSFPPAHRGSTLFGDVDNDGDWDLVLLGTDNVDRSTQLYRNDGSIFAQESAVVLPGVTDGGAAFGDVDNDGDLDLVLTGERATDDYISYLYRNDGSGIFARVDDINTTNTTSGDQFTGMRRGAVAFGDVDNDGDLDLLFVGEGVSDLHKNDGLGNFTQVEDVDETRDGIQSFPPLQYGSHAFFDFDNDGDLDLVLTGIVPGGGSSQSDLYRNDGRGNFTRAASLPSLAYTSVGHGDVNGDGYLDLLISSAYDFITSLPSTRLYINDGSGAFGVQDAPFTSAVTGGHVALGDVDGDGDLDVLRAGNGGLSASPASVELYRNGGAGQFTRMRDINPDDAVEFTKFPRIGRYTDTSADFVDIDNDGVLDVFLTGEDVTNIISLPYQSITSAVPMPPMAPTNLLVQVDGTGVDFSWEAPAPSGHVYSYEVYIGTADSAADGNYDRTPRKTTFHSVDNRWRRLIAEPGAIQTQNWHFTPYNLPPGTYHWAVQAVDGAFGVSPLAASTFEIVNHPPTDIVLASGALWVSPHMALNTVLATFSALDEDLWNTHAYTLLPAAGHEGEADYFTLVNNQLTTAQRIPEDREATGEPLRFLLRAQDRWGGSFEKVMEIVVDDYGNTPGAVGALAPDALSAGDDVFIQGYLALSDEDWIRISLETGRVYGFLAMGTTFDVTLDLYAAADTTVPLKTNSGTQAYFAHNPLAAGPHYLRVRAPSASGSYDLTLSVRPVLDATLPQLQEGAVAFGDVDNDGDLDLVLTGNRGSAATPDPYAGLYVNQAGAFTESAASSVLQGVYKSAVVFGDVDNDGHLDLLLAGATGPESALAPRTHWYRNTGGGAFVRVEDIDGGVVGTAQDQFPGLSGGSAAFGDVDNDGDLDLLLTGTTAGATSISSLYQNDGGGFVLADGSTEGNAALPGVGHGAVAFGDVDNDGDLDLLLSGIKDNNEVLSALYTNDGRGHFESAPTSVVLPGVYETAVAFGDLTHDGFLDILISGKEDAVGNRLSALYQNDGNGVFTRSTQSSVFQDVMNGSFALGDIDNDGDTDLLLTGLDNNSEPFAGLYANDGGTFVADTTVSFQAVYDSSVALGDADGDGDLDAMLAGTAVSADTNTAPFSALYRSDYPSVSAVPATPTDLSAVVDPSERTVTLSWQAVVPGHTNYTYEVYVGTSDGASDGNYDLSPRKTFSDADGNWHRVVAALGPIQSEQWIFRPAAIGDYHWAVQAVGSNFDVSPLVAGGSFRVPNAPPTAIRFDVPFVRVSPQVAVGDGVAMLSTEDADADDTHTYTFLGLDTGLTRMENGVEVVDYQNTDFFRMEDDDLLLNTEVYDDPSQESLLAATLAVRSVDSVGNAVVGTIALRLDYGDTQGTAEFFDVSPESAESSTMPGGWHGTDDVDWFQFSLEKDTRYAFRLQLLAGTHVGAFTIYKAEGGDRLPELLRGETQASDTYGHTEVYISGMGGLYYARLAVVSDPAMDTPPFLYRFTIEPAPDFARHDNTDFGSRSADTFALGDLTNDGYQDLLTMGSLSDAPSFSWHRNDNGSGFVDATAAFSHLWAGALALGDVDADGDLDVFATGEQLPSGYTIGSTLPVGSVADVRAELYENDGSGTFTLAVVDTDEGTAGVQSFQGVRGGSVDFGDIDNDGDLDLLLTGEYPVSAADFLKITHLYENDGARGFVLVTDVDETSGPDDEQLPGVRGRFVDFADIDTDGDLDLLLMDDAVSHLYRNDGAGNLTRVPDINTTNSINGEQFPTLLSLAGALGDVDNNGTLDLLLTGITPANTAQVSLYLNDGLGNFSLREEAGISEAVAGGAVAFGDVDGDGILDLFLSGAPVVSVPSDYGEYLYYNDGNGHFTPASFASSSDFFPGDRLVEAFAFTDFDNSGDLDFLATDALSPTNRMSALYGNYLNPTPRQTFPPTALSSAVDEERGWVTLRWTEPTDVSGLRYSYEVYVGTADASLDGNYDHSPQKTIKDATDVWRRMTSERGVIQGDTWTFKPKKAGTYHWAVQAVAGAFGVSAPVAGDAFALSPMLTADRVLVDFDEVNVGGDRVEVVVNVKGVFLVADVSLSWQGTPPAEQGTFGFSVPVLSPEAVAPSSGADLTLSYLPPSSGSAGQVEAVLNLSSGTLEKTLTLRVRLVRGEPVLSASHTALDFGGAVLGTRGVEARSFELSGQYLTGGVRLVFSGASGFRASPNALSAEDAMAGRVPVQVTYDFSTATSAEPVMGLLTISSHGVATPVEIELTANVTAPPSVASPVRPPPPTVPPPPVAPPVPVLVVTPSMLDFGDAYIGGDPKSLPLAVRVAHLSSDVSITGAAAGFDVSQTTIAPGDGTHNLEVTYTPPATGTPSTASATLSFHSGGLTQSVQLMARVLQKPVIIVSSATLGFGSVMVGSGEPLIRSVTVQGTDLVDDITLMVAGLAGFNVFPTQVTQQEAAEQAGHEIQVVYDPLQAPGAVPDASGTLIFSSEGADHVRVILQIELLDASQPTFTVSPNPLDFGVAHVGGQPKTFPLVITAYGLSSDIEITGAAEGFAVSRSTIPLAGFFDDRYNLEVSYTPPATSTSPVVSITISFQSGTLVRTVGLTVQLKERPTISASPVPLHLGSAVAGSSTPITGNLRVVGNHLLEGIALKVTGAQSFEVVPALVSPADAVVPGRDVTVAYYPFQVPDARGPLSGTLTLSSKGAVSLQIPLRVEQIDPIPAGNEPFLLVTPQHLDFGTMRIGAPVRQRSLTVLGSNLPDDVTITSATNGFSAAPASLSLSESTTGEEVVVSYDSSTAARVGNLRGMLHFNSGDVAQTIELTVLLEDSGAVLMVSADVLDFGSSFLSADTVLTKTLTVNGQNLPNNVALSLTGSSVFSLSADSLARRRVIRSAGAELTVHYDPSLASSAGEATAELRMQSGLAVEIVTLKALLLEVPVLQVSHATLDFGKLVLESDEPVTRTLTVLGMHLVGDVFLSVDGPGFSVLPHQVPQTSALLGSGQEVVVTYDLFRGVELSVVTGMLVVSSEGADTVSADLQVQIVSPPPEEPVDLSVLTDSPSFVVQPNPAHEVVYITYPVDGLYRVTVYSLGGVPLLSAVLRGKRSPIRLDIASFKTGAYVMHLTHGGKNAFYRLLKE